MELDLQRFYRINRRFLMWIAFFVILFLLRDFFALMFLTFIFAFVMRKVAGLLLRIGPRLPYWFTVVGPYLIVVALLVLLMTTAVPKLYDEGLEFSHRVPGLLQTLATEIHRAALRHNLEDTLAKYLQADEAGHLKSTEAAGPDGGGSPATRPATAPARITNEAIIDKFEELALGFLPAVEGTDRQGALPALLVRFVKGLTGGMVTFLLAIVLSFLIVLDYDRIRHEIGIWSQAPVGRFFHEASASVVQFSEMVGTAFQCQLIVAALNTVITAAGLLILRIEPLLLLTTIVFIFGLIPVLGVWISSVPIVLIAFNDHGWERAVLAVVLITVVHLLEAYVFNPRIYAARFHLNPVIVLIILLVGHELFGVWGMLLGIPVTYYVLNVAGVVPLSRKQRRPKGFAQPPAPDADGSALVVAEEPGGSAPC
ncbi:MAG: AI-2E family transporter [Phycisphaerae bacterium]